MDNFYLVRVWSFQLPELFLLVKSDKDDDDDGEQNYLSLNKSKVEQYILIQK